MVRIAVGRHGFDRAVLLRYCLGAFRQTSDFVAFAIGAIRSTWVNEVRVRRGMYRYARLYDAWTRLEHQLWTSAVRPMEILPQLFRYLVVIRSCTRKEKLLSAFFWGLQFASSLLTGFQQSLAIFIRNYRTIVDGSWRLRLFPSHETLPLFPPTRGKCIYCDIIRALLQFLDHLIFVLSAIHEVLVLFFANGALVQICTNGSTAKP